MDTGFCLIHTEWDYSVRMGLFSWNIPGDRIPYFANKIPNYFYPENKEIKI